MRPELGVCVTPCIDYVLVQTGGLIAIPQPLGDARPVQPPEHEEGTPVPGAKPAVVNRRRFAVLAPSRRQFGQREFLEEAVAQRTERIRKRGEHTQPFGGVPSCEDEIGAGHLGQVAEIALCDRVRVPPSSCYYLDLEPLERRGITIRIPPRQRIAASGGRPE